MKLQNAILDSLQLLSELLVPAYTAIAENCTLDNLPLDEEEIAFLAVKRLFDSEDGKDLLVLWGFKEPHMTTYYKNSIICQALPP